MLASYHTHSRWSDGKATPAEMLAAAQAMNLGELGFSDHWVLHPRGEKKPWSMPADRLPDYVNEISSLRERSELDRSATVVRLGLEVDWFPGHGAALRRALEGYAFDYLIGSVHEVEVAGVGPFMIDMSPAAWEKLTQSQRDAIHRQYWINLRSLGESGLFDVVAHIDLPKKFGFPASIDLSREIAAALDALASAPREIVVELNTSGWHKPCADAYPTIGILQQCRQRDLKVTLSADAHQPEHLLRDFAQGAERLTASGYTHVARFERRRIRLEPIEESFVPAEQVFDVHARSTIHRGCAGRGESAE